mgnify:CR=1 FL=1
MCMFLFVHVSLAPTAHVIPNLPQAGEESQANNRELPLGVMSTPCRRNQIRSETPRFSRGDIEKYPHIGLTSGRFSLQLFDILLAESEIGGVGMVENHRRNR